jgi:hypothetical protein
VYSNTAYGWREIHVFKFDRSTGMLAAAVGGCWLCGLLTFLVQCSA